MEETFENVTDSMNGVTVKMVLASLVLSSVIIMTLCGNVLVVTAVIKFHRLRSVTNYLLVSLAIADLTVAFLVMPYSLMYEVVGQWRLGWTFCNFFISCDVMCCTASILHLCIISLDRYFAITEPLTYKAIMSKRKVLLMIGSVWVCSAAISFVPIFLGWYANEGAVTTPISNICRLDVNQTYAVVSSMTSFYVPLIVMVFAYVTILRIAQKQANEIAKLEKSVAYSMVNKKRLKKRSKRLSKDTKAVRTLGILMGLFCFCWLPFFLVYIIMPFCAQCHVSPVVESAITWLGYCNSFINPCIYACLNRDFRIAFRRLLPCCWCLTCFETRRGSNDDVTLSSVEDKNKSAVMQMPQREGKELSGSTQRLTSSPVNAKEVTHCAGADAKPSHLHVCTNPSGNTQWIHEEILLVPDAK